MLGCALTIKITSYFISFYIRILSLFNFWISIICIIKNIKSLLNEVIAQVKRRFRGSINYCFQLCKGVVCRNQWSISLPLHPKSKKKTVNLAELWFGILYEFKVWVSVTYLSLKPGKTKSFVGVYPRKPKGVCHIP